MSRNLKVVIGPRSVPVVNDVKITTALTLADELINEIEMFVAEGVPADPMRHADLLQSLPTPSFVSTAADELRRMINRPATGAEIEALVRLMLEGMGFHATDVQISALLHVCITSVPVSNDESTPSPVSLAILYVAASRLLRTAKSRPTPAAFHAACVNAREYVDGIADKLVSASHDLRTLRYQLGEARPAVRQPRLSLVKGETDALF